MQEKSGVKEKQSVLSKTMKEVLAWRKPHRSSEWGWTYLVLGCGVGLKTSRLLEDDKFPLQLHSCQVPQRPPKWDHRIERSVPSTCFSMCLCFCFLIFNLAAGNLINPSLC